jgi:PPP family 3-phenylpropionic acid transporter
LQCLWFVLSPFGGLLDAISLEYTTAAQIKYGPIRCVGSLVFGVISLLLTLVLTFFGNYTDVRIIFPVFACMAVFAAVSVKLMPAVKGHAHGKRNLPVKEFFKDKTCIVLIIILFAGQFSFGCYYNFMQNFMEENLNLAPWVWGLSVFFMIVGEVIFFFKYDYFFKRFSIKKIVVFSILMQVLRYLSLAFLHDRISILITSLLTGSFCAVVHYAASYYINLTVKKEMKSLGQTLLFAISFYIPRFLSGIIGGFTVEHFGFAALMIICTVLNFILLAASKFMPIKNPA